MSNVKQLYERLRALPWPVLARSVGDFALYETLLTGCADRFARGGLVDTSKIPAPDEETIARVNLLRKKNALTQEERAFLEYFELLEEIRSALRGV